MKKEEIQNLIKELIEKTTIPVREITIEEKDGKNTWVSVEVSEPYYFLGRGGEGLSALNHIVRRIVESKMPITEDPKEGLSVLVDINGFQKKFGK